MLLATIADGKLVASRGGGRKLQKPNLSLPVDGS